MLTLKALFSWLFFYGDFLSRLLEGCAALKSGLE